jgi:hypothetical protein
MLLLVVSMMTRAPPTWHAARARDFDHQAAHADHPAVYLNTVEFVNLFGQRLHGAIAVCVRLVTSGAPVLTLYLPAPLIIALVLGKGRLVKPSGGASLENRLAPELNLKHERPRGSKSNLLQHLKAIR